MTNSKIIYIGSILGTLFYFSCLNGFCKNLKLTSASTTQQTGFVCHCFCTFCCSWRAEICRVFLNITGIAQRWTYDGIVEWILLYIILNISEYYFRNLVSQDLVMLLTDDLYASKI